MLRSAHAARLPSANDQNDDDVTGFSEITEAVIAAAKGLRYGSIEVVVHEGRVTQVIRSEKRRVLR